MNSTHHCHHRVDDGVIEMVCSSVALVDEMWHCRIMRCRWPVVVHHVVRIHHTCRIITHTAQLLMVLPVDSVVIIVDVAS